ncbi:FecR family protein [Flexithrix dorotheae]|uniref:FecR family protein n=1 Tax=Flexithrix dorotheae TaxID=70993 RepID=UPI000379A759|nr:FecR family protein [Flexithrix dorotheae]
MKGFDKSLIKKYLNNTCSVVEAEKVLQWFETTEGKNFLEKDFLPDPVPEKNNLRALHYNPEQGLKSIKENASKLHILKPEDKKQNQKNHFWTSKKIAASILLLLGIGLSFHYYWVESSKEKIKVAQKVEDEILKITSKGQKTVFYLPDGTKVKLNSESAFKYPKIFSGKNRVVKLLGEAFIEVAKNPDQPFIVYSGEVSTKALGTSFNIRAYPEDEQINVALTTGKVVVGEHDNIVENGSYNNIFLIPGEKYSFNKSNKSNSKSKFSMEEIGWINGELIFEDASLETIEKELERWFGVDIKIKNHPVQFKPYTGHHNNENLRNILENIKIASNIDFELNDKKVIIR